MESNRVLKTEDLRKLQLVETGILKAFDSICSKYNIQYFICYGTAIGAIRHRGFIPWDDDIDVGMLRSEYEKLKKVPKSEWGGYCISLVDPADECDAHLWTYPRLYKNGTIFESGNHYYEISKRRSDTSDLRVWLDIFLYDRFDDVQSIEKMSKRIFLLKKLYYYSVSNRVIRKEDPLKRKLVEVIELVAHFLLRLLPNPKKVIWNRIQSLLTYSSGELVTTFDTPYKATSIVCCYADMFPTERVVFEGIEVCIQKNYDSVLRSIYGDYMQLPPEEKRTTHVPVILDLGDGRGNVVCSENTGGVI